MDLMSLSSLSLSTTSFLCRYTGLFTPCQLPQNNSQTIPMATKKKKFTTHIKPILNLLSQCIRMYKCNIIHAYTCIDLCVYVKRLSANARPVSLP